MRGTLCSAHFIRDRRTPPLIRESRDPLAHLVYSISARFADDACTFARYECTFEIDETGAAVATRRCELHVLDFERDVSTLIAATLAPLPHAPFTQTVC